MIRLFGNFIACNWINVFIMIFNRCEMGKNSFAFISPAPAQNPPFSHRKHMECFDFIVIAMRFVYTLYTKPHGWLHTFIEQTPNMNCIRNFHLNSTALNQIDHIKYWRVQSSLHIKRIEMCCVAAQWESVITNVHVRVRVNARASVEIAHEIVVYLLSDLNN